MLPYNIGNMIYNDHTRYIVHQKARILFSVGLYLSKSTHRPKSETLRDRFWMGVPFYKVSNFQVCPEFFLNLGVKRSV